MIKDRKELENIIIDLISYKETLKDKTFGLTGSRKKGYTTDQIDRYSASYLNKAKIRTVNKAIRIAKLNLKLLKENYN